MGYLSDSRRKWAGACWATTAIPLVLDPWNPMWDESGLLEEQFGAPFAPSRTIWGNDYFTPNFWAGRSSETVGRRGPRTSPIASLIIRGTCGAQSSNLILQKKLPWTPPLKKKCSIYIPLSCPKLKGKVSQISLKPVDIIKKTYNLSTYVYVPFKSRNGL